jgi:alpha-tubulin suppressor-like RCC1 family protein
MMLVWAGCGRIGFDLAAVGRDGAVGDGEVDAEDLDASELDAAGTDAAPIGPVAAIDVGNQHTCVLMNRGAVRCWGAGSLGQLGAGNMSWIGDDETAASAVDVPFGAVPVHLATGSLHSCAALTTGAVYCWGSGLNGRLGYGSTSNLGDSEPITSLGPLALVGSAAQVTAGDAHSCALMDTGAVRCWGSGTGGRLGYVNTVPVGDDETLAALGDIDLGGPAVQIVAGGRHTCARLDSGAVRCWGEGTYGALGYGNSSNVGDDETPASVGDVPLGGLAIDLAAGDQHTCAVMTTGAVRCWGRGMWGALGYGNTTTIGDDEPAMAAGEVPLGASAVQVAAGERHSCARLDTGQVRCWGEGAQGKLGYGNQTAIGDDEAPSSVGDVPVE